MLPQTVLLLAPPSRQLTILGYVDPGSGTLIWQLATAGVLGLLFYGRNLMQKLRLLTKTRAGNRETKKVQEP
jgi:hypothetical protein